MFSKNKIALLFFLILFILFQLNVFAAVAQDKRTHFAILDEDFGVDTKWVESKDFITVSSLDRQSLIAYTHNKDTAHFNNAKDHEIELLISKTYQTLQGIKGGKNADYIPELAKVPSELLGIALVTVDGEIYTAGNVDYIFSIQSISKPFTAALMMMDYQSTKAIVDKIGVEPTGLPFNSVIALEIIPKRTGNPLVNAGAIATVSYLRGSDPDEKFNRIISFYGRLANEELTMMDNIYISEASSNYRNRSLAYLMHSYELMGADPMESVDVYTRQCSIGVNTMQLAIMGATLANNGINPLSGEELIDKEFIPQVLALMTMAGLYDESGLWAYTVGLPTKTGVGGGVLAVAPGKLAIAVFSPPLNEAGNSVRGLKAIEFISTELHLNLFATNQAYP